MKKLAITMVIIVLSIDAAAIPIIAYRTGREDAQEELIKLNCDWQSEVTKKCGKP